MPDVPKKVVKVPETPDDDTTVAEPLPMADQPVWHTENDSDHSVDKNGVITRKKKSRDGGLA